MKRLLLYILLVLNSLLLPTMAKAVELSSNDPYWIGNAPSFTSTEGNDFWLAFMNNAMFNPTDPNTELITFELKIAASARENTDIIVEIGTFSQQYTIKKDSTIIIDIDKSLYEQIYLWKSETPGYRGVHVYSVDKDKKFSCFNYSRNGESGESSRDATLIIPTKFLGKEYYVQTYYEDTYSSEFAVVATEDQTKVTITPSYETFMQNPAGVGMSITLNKGEAYLVASKLHTNSDVKVGLSGSSICADKPVAVFNGNQQTSIPFHESNSKDYLSEEIIPITQWGRDFYMAKLGGTLENNAIFTAAYNDTHITMDYVRGGNTYSTTMTLAAGQTTSPVTLSATGMTELRAHSDQPVMCYYYTTSGGKNGECSDDPFDPVCYYYGDPANALVPSWEHRTTSMNFFTHDLDPFTREGEQAPPQKYYLYVVTRTTDINKLTLDGKAVEGSAFKAFASDNMMSYASIEITNPDSHYHVLESDGEGFVGMVYALTDAQGYFYTLGYNPDPFRDSLFVSTPENIMSPKSYDVEPRLDQGWYQRQWDEWMSDHERLDTAIVCDSSIVSWMLQTPIMKHGEPVDWYIYDVTDTEPTIYKTYSAPIDSTKQEEHQTIGDNWAYKWQYQFILPDESDLDPMDRKPFMDYEVQAVIHHKHVICTDLPDDMDTLRMVVRVTRIYHDTIYREICMGDTLRFFYDNMPFQNNLSITSERTDSTLYIGDKSEGESTIEFECKARSGENIFRREYQTVYGCDSTFTLFLFVCDTFRQIDTVYLCKNEKFTYLEGSEYEKTYKGVEAEGPGIVVLNDTVDIIEAKTKYCPCQFEPYSEKYPPFQGCDSIFELYIFINEIHRDTIVDTMCYNHNPDSIYIWPIQNNTKELQITKSHPDIHYDARLRTWEGFFSDTLRTSTCDKCNNGKGCDSIKVLHLYIPEPFYDKQKDSICQWDYDKTTRTIRTNIYQWEKHRDGAAYVELPEDGIYYDSCLTRFGCDSIYQLELKYTRPFLQVDKHSMANNDTYTWHGKTYGPFPDIKKDSTLYFHNDNEPQTNPVNGCDSLYRLELTISDTYLFKHNDTICDVDSVHWRGKIIVGSKWEGTDSFDKRLTDAHSTVFYDSLKTTELPVRDSVYQLTVIQYRTYDKTLAPVSLCQDDSHYEWRRADNGQLIMDILLPQKDQYPFDTTYTARLDTKTPLACDSVLHLPIVIYPTYDTTTTVVICDRELPYRWSLRDSGVHDKTVNRPASAVGTVWHYTDSYTLTTIHGCDSIVHLDLTVKPTTVHEYYVSWCANQGPYEYGEKGKTATKSDVYIDTLLTPNQYGCDSVEIVHLTINPSYAFTTDTVVCQNTSFTWRYHEGHSLRDINGNELTVIPTDHSGSFTYTDHLKSSNGCDSIWTLNLQIDSIYTTPVTITERQMCENDTLHFYDKILYGAKWKELPAGETGYAVPEGSSYYELPPLEYTDKTMSGCDSAVQHRVIVYPTRYYMATDTVCLDSVNIRYTWANHPDIKIFQNTAGTFTYIDSLQSAHSDCNCDSIFELQLTVLPSYHKSFRHTMSDEETYTWEGVTYGGTKTTLPYDVMVTNDTVITVHYPTATIGTRSCDSTLVLNLRMGMVFRDTTYQYVCQSEPYYEWKRANQNGVIELRRTISGNALPEVGQHRLYYDSLRTSLDFDSIFVLDLYRAPTHEYDTTMHICQGSPFIWINHTGSRNNVMDANGNPVTQISTEHHGDFYYYDRLQTDSFGCDSVWTLHLYVDSVYRFTTDTSVCQFEQFAWLRHEGHTLQDLNGNDLTEISTDHIGTYVYTDHMYTSAGCDSIWTLRLRVDSVYTAPVSITQRHMCENDTIQFYDQVIYGAKSPLKPSSEPGFIVPEGQHSISFVLEYHDRTIHGCDSLVQHRINIYPTYLKEHKDSICQGSAYEWEGHTSQYIWDHQQQKRILLTEIPTNLKSGVEYLYTDSLHTKFCPECRDGEGGCDSIWVLQLRVDSVYYHADTITMSDEESRKWQHTVYIGSKVNADTLGASWFDGEDTQQIVRIPEGKIINEFDTIYPTIHKCDSTIHLRLLVGPTYRDTIEGWTCDNEPYHWYHAGDSVHEARPDIVILEPGLYYDSLKTKEFGFDSIYVLNLYNYPTYDFPAYDTVCQNTAYLWDGHTESDRFYSVEAGQWISREAIPTNIAGHFTYIDSLKTHEPESHLDRNRHSGCDSVWTLHLYIPPTYHHYDSVILCAKDSLQWQGMLFTGDEYTTYGKTYDAAGFDSTRTSLPAGKYDIAIRRGTYYYDCDSVHHLHLVVNPVHRETITRRACQTADGYYYENLNNGTGGLLSALHLADSLTRNDTISTVLGCDSIVTLRYYVDSVYDYRQHFVFCQDTIDTKREWIDNEGHTHTFQMDVSRAGDFDFTEHHTTIHGCDSVYGITWHVNPIYRFDSTYVICQDERISWQRKWYSGDEYGWGFERLQADRYDTHRDSVYHHYIDGDSLLSVGTYYDTAHYITTAGCDSTFYLKLIVNPAGHYIRNEVACDRDGYHVFYTEDAFGQHTDTIFFSPTTRMYDETRKDTMCYEAERRLTAVNGGCDSTILFHLTVHPSYEYVTRSQVCRGDSVEWRGRTYHATGVYYDSIAGGTDYWHCDSVYVLELYVKPVTLIPIYDTICDNTIFEHTDTLWYTNGSHSYVETLVWKPGMTIPQTYTDVIFKSPIDGCDSIIYRYFLTIHKSYLFRDTATICSNESYTSHGHTFTGYEYEYEPGEDIAPFDTVIVDNYSTIHQCDSVFELYATIRPAYRHIDYITICDDGEADWRTHHYEGSMIGNTFGSGLPAGQYTFYDSLTTIHNCDSIYELRLTVTPTYLFEETVTKCADDDMTWHGHILDHLPVGDHFFYDSTTTVIYGCDSVYHLYLTVVDTTFEVRYDTICRTESYNLHGVYLMEPGSYKDTTLNDWGCHHFTYLHLEVIEPTVPTAWADSICADDDAYELFYRYTGRDPIAFSLYYNDFGHQYGFEDQIDIPITTTEELAVLTIPMPFRDDDKRKYPRPDHYPVKLVLDNGICTNPDLCSTDTSIVLNYPSWVTEQRFRDVIAILQEDYNGGYTFSHYQWYRNGEPIPGEALPYLYIPRELDSDTVEYSVRLIREGETESYQTCPIRIYDDFGTDTIAPYMGYLSVVPTCVSTGNPVISILSRHKGTYNIGSVTGKLITSGSFTPDVTEVRLPAQEGIYIVHLWSDETPEEPERTIKVQMVSGDRLW